MKDTNSRVSLVKSIFVVLALIVLSTGTVHAADQYGSTTTNLSVPDNGSWVGSSIVISGAPSGATVTSIDVHFSAVHPYSADLEVDINDQGITRNYDLWSNEGGSVDNPSRTMTGVTTFNGLPVNGTWRLYARDTTLRDAGYIDEWWIRIYYSAVSKPDLVARNLSVSNTNPRAGDSITVYFNIKNQGTATAGASYQGIVLSSDTNITSSDTELAAEYTGTLLAGSDTNESNFGVTIPAGTTGRRYIGIRADKNNSVDESDEGNNNTAYVPIDILGVTVSGTLTYADTTYDQYGFGSPVTRSARGITLQVLGSSGNVLASTVTGDGRNGTAGRFSVFVPTLKVGDSFNLKVVSQNVAGTVGPDSSQIWTASSNSFQASGSTVDASWTLGAAVPNTRASLNILDALLDSYFYSKDTDNLGVGPSQVKVIAPLRCQGDPSGGACYSQAQKTMWLPEGTRDNDDIVLHEGGHFIMDDYTLYMPLPGGRHVACEQASSKDLAFSEGWATYYASAVKKRSWISFRDSIEGITFWFDLENGLTWVRESSCSLETDQYEGATMSVLWDARDGGSSEPFDQISNEARIFEILDEDWNSRTSSPVMDTFRQAWGSTLDPVLCRYTKTYCPGLTGLSINGPSSVNESSSATYTATANWSNGTTSTVSPTWSESSPYASISSGGVLTTSSVSGNESVTVSASYASGGVTKTTNKAVTILNGNRVLTGLSISGASSVNEGSSAAYTATASWDDGSTSTVTPSWSESSPYASIDATGLLITTVVNVNEAVTVTASYTSGTVTKTANKSVTILNTNTGLTLTGLAIDGPAAVSQNSSVLFRALATWSDGSTSYVTPIWSESSPYATISNTGVLTTTSVSSAQTMVLSASYTASGVTKTGSIVITILPGARSIGRTADFDGDGVSDWVIYRNGAWIYFGPCDHPLNRTGEALANGCTACVTKVCNSDPYCCSTEWDSACVEAVLNLCR